MVPQPTKAYRAAKREATQTGRPLSSASTKHKTSKRSWQISLPIHPSRPPPPLLSADPSMASSDNSVAPAAAPHPLLSEATQSSTAPASLSSLATESESDDESVFSGHTAASYVQRRPEDIIENVSAYSAQFEKCGVSFFKQGKFFYKMREFRNSRKQTLRLRDGSMASLQEMVEDFKVQFGRMFWPVDSDEEVDEDEEDSWIAEGVYAYFEQMQRLRFRLR